MKPAPLGCVVIGLTFLVTLSSCSTARVDVSPDSVEVLETAPAPQAGTVENWVAIEVEQECSRGRTECQSGQYHFFRDGLYSAKTTSGQISELELFELLDVADAIARQDLLGLEKSCEPVGKIEDAPGEPSSLKIEIELKEAKKQVIIYDFNSTGRCILGEKAPVNDLRKLLGRLLIKYAA